MPYASNKQAAYLHIHHPEIAAKWHEEGKGYVKGGKNDPNRKKRRRVRKAKVPGWLQPLAIGTAGGALANQLPSFEQQQQMRENRRRRKAYQKKGVAKALTPEWPDDGFFNAKAAQEAYDLVMKMDPASAEMFVTCVVTDALEADIEANRRTLQKHLDEVVEKQLSDLKRATLRVVSKQEGDSEEQIAFAQAIAVLEEICKVKSPYDYGYVFQESNIRRDPGSGQFQTKVKRTQAKPINDKVALSLGIEPPKKKLTDKQKAQYQDEYRQLANFLGMVNQSSANPGDTRVNLHFSDKHGNQWTEQASGTRPRPKMLDPTDRKLEAISAYPEGLTLGGAAFGLAGAMGASGTGTNPMRLAQINAAGRNMPEFAERWTQDYGRQNTNAQLYGRTGAAGKLLTEVAPAGSKANLAGHFGQFVGQYGPQAEAVIGPPARRTAYRYRGTEKKPDPAMLREYEVAVRRQMGNRDWSEEQERAIKTAQNRAVRARESQIADEKGIMASEVRLSQTERAEIMNAAAAKAKVSTPANKPTWTEQNAAAAAIAEYLQRPHDQGGAAPRKGLYNLQLASGNTPPSEGVILNADGQVVTQAIGYGDDHYLPFNLKNLKSLKGGQYIRNRSVGGLTSEDIYTGLVSGARRVTVVSRSGTFTMEFEPDFRGGRRHNDKAARMTRRYEQILDAVQSEQVERQNVDPDVRRAITQAVQTEADQSGFGWDKKAIRDDVNRRIEDYKSSPDIDAETQEYIDLIVNNRTAGMTSPDAKQIRATIENQVAKDKEYKFRLNGAGYADALESLREQFPYYIKVNSVPTKEEERFETERDKGYVEPGKIRPTAAAAGLFGATQQMPYKAAGKISAAEADFAGRFRRTEPPAPTATTEAGETPKVEGQKETPKAPEPTVAEQAKYTDAAVALHAQIKAHARLADTDKNAKWLNMSSDEFRGALATDKDVQRNFDQWVEANGNQLAAGFPEDVRQPLAGYKQASGRIGAKPYEAVLNQQWNTKPFAFEGKAYQSDATASDRHREIVKIGAQIPGVVNVKPLDHMTDKELKQEVDAVGNIRSTLRGLTGQPDWETRKAIFENVNKESPSLQRVFKDENAMDSYLETVHRTRAINQSVPEGERGFREQFHPPATKEKNSEEPVRDGVENVSYLADKAADFLPVDSPEYSQIADLATDLRMQKDRIKTPQQLAAVMDQNRDAWDVITRLIAEEKIPAGQHVEGRGEKPPERRALPGGPILS